MGVSRRSLVDWIPTGVAIGVLAWVVVFTPFAGVFGLSAYERSHGKWPDLLLALVILIAARALYLRFFQHSQTAAEYAAIREEARSGRLRRMSPAARWMFLVGALVLVCMGWFAPEPHGTQLLRIGVPLFLLFAAVELNFILQPGDTLLPDRGDELLMFFKSRLLSVGYVTAILSLAVLYLASLLVPRYLGVLLPIVLTLSLLAPALLYARLNRQAGVND